MNKTDEFLKMSRLLGHLKHLPRAGWVRKGIKNPESVASHSHRMAMMALFLKEEIAESGADSDRVVQMALCHDIAESVVGDILPEKFQEGEKISKEEKRRLEQEAVDSFFSCEEVRNLFGEYESKRTKESLWCHDLDVLDMILQAKEYLEENPSSDLAEFFENKDRLSISLCRRLAEEIIKS